MNIVKTYPNAMLLRVATAELFARKACLAVEKCGRCNVVLAGGETPRLMYELLAAKPYCSEIPWAHIYIFWGDERCVPGDNDLSNQFMARQSLLDHVPIPAANIHPIVYESSPSIAAEEYEKELHAIFGDQTPQFDIVLLGLGDNGHTASLFPHTDALKIKDHWVSHVYVAEQRRYRVTLTAPILNQAAVIVFLVAGSNKAQVVKEVIEGPPDYTRLPAQLIKPVNGELYWLLDQDAAALLSEAHSQ